MKSLTFYIGLCLSILLFSCERKPVTFCVLGTGLLRGEIGSGLASTAAYIREEQTSNRDQVILLDNGDFLQGTPEAFFANYVDTTKRPVISSIFSYLQYDAISFGRTEFEVDANITNRVTSSCSVPFVCANIIHKETGKPYLTPYTVFQKQGYKIAVLGLISSSELNWIPESISLNYECQPLKEAAAFWVEAILQQEKPDVLIGLFHGGDEVSWVAQNIPGIDLIYTDLEEASAEAFLNPKGETIWVLSTGSSSSHIAQANISLTPVEQGEPKLQVVPQILATASFPEDPNFNQVIAPFMQRANTFFAKSISEIPITVYSREALQGPCPWTNILHKTYRYISEQMGNTGGAKIDISIASASYRNAVIYAGPVTVRDFVQLYPYENTLSIVEMNGAEFLAYLEYCVSLFVEDYNSPVYHLDTAAGCEYSVDKTKPYGQRVTITKMSDGNQFYLERRYHIAMTSYRALGGGGHLKNSLHWSAEKMKARCIANSPRSILASMVQIYTTRPIDPYSAL